MSSNTSPLRSFRLIIIGALALMIGLIAAIWLQQPATVAIESGTMLQTPRPLGDFNAIDENGAPLTRAQLKGHWPLIFPGFTNCPDACPTTLAVLAPVDKRLGDAARKLRVDFFRSAEPTSALPSLMRISYPVFLF